MTSKEFAKKVIEIHKETKKELLNLKTVEIAGNDMINSDVEKTIKAQGYQKIHELIINLNGGNKNVK